MLSALIEWVKGMLTKKGCGGINTISRETGSFPPSCILSRQEYITPSFALGTTPKIVSFDSYITLYRDIFTSISLISELFQLKPKHRHSGMDRRNLGSMDGGVRWHPCNLDSGDPCRNDELLFFMLFPEYCLLALRFS